MGLDLHSLASKRASRTFEFDGEQVTITFYPHKITPEYRAKLAALAQKAKGGDEDEGPEEEAGYRSTLKEASNEEHREEQKQQDAKMVSELLESWDVQLGGEPYPPTYENLLPVPVTLLGRVSSEIMEVIQELTRPTRKKK